MNKMRCARASILALLVATLSLEGCGGGSGGGGGTSDSPVLVMITAAGIPNPLWQNVQGTPVSPPNCTSAVFLNSTITFTFGGPVDAASLPLNGLAQGSINITTIAGTTNTPALGTFSVSDDPSLPAGNRRRVSFLPTPPSNPNAPTTAGLTGNIQYNIFVPRGGLSTQVVTIGGQANSIDATTCFVTCNPSPTPSNCFTDPVTGPPYVINTTPTTFDPAPGTVNPTQIAQNKVSIFFSEPLSPSGININAIVLKTPSGAQVPGDIQFFQAGTPEAGPQGARIDYIATSQLLSNTNYELTISSAVRDFGNNPVALYNPAATGNPASLKRFFQTIVLPVCLQPAIFEPFDTITNRASTQNDILWTGNGVVQATFPASIVGTGTFGALNISTAGASSLDPGQTGVTGLANGVWNTTSINVVAGAIVRCTGHTTGNRWRVHLRSLGAVTINGTLNASAGNTTTALVGTTEQGALPGQFNNGAPTLPLWVAGGVGGSGGGKGGDASQADKTTGTLQVRTNVAEAGFGPPLDDGSFNTGPVGGNPRFGGGAGGASAFIAGQGGVTGDVGGLGGAGGSAFATGLDGGPFAALAPCGPIAVNQTRAAGTGPTAAFAFPLSIQSAGSGGGGGGDHLDSGGVAGDDQGAGGGGGGGGIRISSVGNITFGSAAAITCDGANGGVGNVFQGGNGGSGSGGEIWLQSFGQLIITTTTVLRVNNGTVSSACGNQGAGRGGIGAYQLEDSDGTFVTNFSGAPAGGANISAIQFPYSTNVVGIATSNFFDTGYGAPDYLTPVEVSATGNAPAATVTITYQGAFENVSGGGPNLTSPSPFVTAANIDQLDGYRFIRFRIQTSYASPPASNQGNTFPSVDSISISFQAPIGCP